MACEPGPHLARSFSISYPPTRRRCWTPMPSAPALAPAPLWCPSPPPGESGVPTGEGDAAADVPPRGGRPAGLAPGGAEGDAGVNGSPSAVAACFFWSGVGCERNLDWGSAGTPGSCWRLVAAASAVVESGGGAPNGEWGVRAGNDPLGYCYEGCKLEDQATFAHRCMVRRCKRYFRRFPTLIRACVIPGRTIPCWAARTISSGEGTSNWKAGLKWPSLTEIPDVATAPGPPCGWRCAEEEEAIAALIAASAGGSSCCCLGA